MKNERPSLAVEMTGTVKNGVFLVDDKRSLGLRIAKLPDGPALLRIEPAYGARTAEDNRRYHAILHEAAQQSGISHDELHEHYKRKFNDGRSTTALDERRFRVYVDMVMGDAAAEWGVEFPTPEVLVR